MAVGSSGHAKTELLNLSTLTWYTIADYPFADGISSYAVVYNDDNFYVFGGDSGYHVSTIARLGAYSRVWHKMGDLRSARAGHGVILSQGSYLIVGGENTQRTEKCTISGDSITCIDQQPKLEMYSLYPELFPVESDFCQAIFN